MRWAHPCAVWRKGGVRGIRGVFTIPLMKHIGERRRAQGEEAPAGPFLGQSHTRARGRLTVRNVSYTNSRAAGIPCPPAGFAGGPPPACNVRIPRAAPRRGGEGKTFFFQDGRHDGETGYHFHGGPHP